MASTIENAFRTSVAFLCVISMITVTCIDLDIDFELISQEVTRPSLSEEQNDFPELVLVETEGYYVTGHVTTEPPITTTTFSMWLHMSQGFSKQKSKERYCMRKMSECLEDQSNTDQNSAPEAPENSDNGVGGNEFIPEPTTKRPVEAAQEAAYDADSSADVSVSAAVEKSGTSASDQKVTDDSSSSAIRCNTQNFMHLRDCCPSSPTELFNGAIVYACAEGFSLVPRTLLREYTLNVGQNENNMINLTSSSTFSGEMLGASVCFTECVFKKRSLITRDDYVNYDMVRYYFTKAVGIAWQHVVIGMVNSCAASIKSIHPEARMHKSESEFDYCLVHPFLLLQCIRKSLLLACPITGKESKAMECAITMQNLKKCDIFKAPST